MACLSVCFSFKYFKRFRHAETSIKSGEIWVNYEEKGVNYEEKGVNYEEKGVNYEEKGVKLRGKGGQLRIIFFLLAKNEFEKTISHDKIKELSIQVENEKSNSPKIQRLGGGFL
jgi:hypothetical protein